MAGAEFKEKLLDLRDNLQEQARRFYEDFKEQTVFFKAKAGVIAGYILVVVLSVIVLPPPVEKNPLDARIKVGKISFGSREKTFIEIGNDSKSMWESASITITGVCERNGQPVRGPWTGNERFRKGERKTLFADNFKDKVGFRPEIDFTVETVTLEVEGVSWTKDLRKKTPP
ncbi:MAG: hypothetical protein HY904_13570 [Deltaproteobacteria bacterium]|nr:hypothetical protein [Deltaproteobacteria bacterium]